MGLFGLFAILVTVTAFLGWVNERWLRLPTTIGVMLISLGISVLLVLLGSFGLGVEGWAEALVGRVDFGAVLMEGMLSFLLFAGALHVDLPTLITRRWSILSLATFGVVLSTFMIGTGAWLLFGWVGFDTPYVWCLLFGALITPTDPIAVLGVLKRAKVSRDLEAMIAGESLFNDGIGVVVFLTILELITAEHATTVLDVARLFAVEAIGGAIVGLGLGYTAYRMLKTVDNYSVEVLITLALVAGGYSLAGEMHTSGPIAMVVAGLFIGNHGRLFGMSDRTREHLDTFWELIDETLNALLFVLIGFELLLLDTRPRFLAVGLLAIPLVVGSRFVAVLVPLSALRRFRRFPPYAVTMLGWCGVRGGISIALALSLPASPHRPLILMTSYVIVIFSIVVQGLTVGRVARWTASRG